MRTHGLIFADEGLIQDLEGDQAVQQVANVAHLPGIIGPAIAMPDIHWGYGFPIGGVAGFDEAEGVVSPGGVGYDINCGVRLLATPLSITEARPRLAALMDALYRTIPSGVGASRSDVTLQRRELEAVQRAGFRAALTTVPDYAASQRVRPWGALGRFALPRFPYPDDRPHLVHTVAGLARLKQMLGGGRRTTLSEVMRVLAAMSGLCAGSPA